MRNFGKARRNKLFEGRKRQLNANAFCTLDDALKTSARRVFARDRIPGDLALDWYIGADSE